jgi:hypothetical protein
VVGGERGVASVASLQCNAVQCRAMEAVRGRCNPAMMQRCRDEQAHPPSRPTGPSSLRRVHGARNMGRQEEPTRDRTSRARVCKSRMRKAILPSLDQARPKECQTLAMSDTPQTLAGWQTRGYSSQQKPGERVASPRPNLQFAVGKVVGQTGKEVPTADVRSAPMSGIMKPLQDGPPLARCGLSGNRFQIDALAAPHRGYLGTPLATDAVADSRTLVEG